MKRLVVLKSPPYGEWQRTHPGTLPYGIQHLAEHGWSLQWTDARHRRPWNHRVVGRLEALATPFVQTVAMASRIRRADAVLAMFESEGHASAAWRAMVPAFGRRRAPLVIVSCWLGELAQTLPERRLRLYRRLYRHVDVVTVFSHNQVPILQERLGIPAHRIAVVPFGIHLQDLAHLPTRDDGGVVAVGRDRGRDWATFFDAVRGTGWKVTVATRPSQVQGLDVPAEVELLGYVDRPRYLELLASATVVVLTTHDLAYPTGQTVLLEAFALGKPVVVTATPAMAEYLPEGGALPVPLHDAAAVRAAIAAVLADASRRWAMGSAAQVWAERRASDATMWHAIGRALEREG